jgi:hypothetical protein
MSNYFDPQFFFKIKQSRLQVCVVTALCLLTIGCSTPKNYQLASMAEFKGTSCAILANRSAISGAGRYSPDKSLITPQKLHLFLPEEPIPDSMKNFGTLDAGTKINISDLRTQWDFENGHRLMVEGSMQINGAQRPFFAERFFIKEPTYDLVIRRLFTPC